MKTCIITILLSFSGLKLMAAPPAYPNPLAGANLQLHFKQGNAGSYQIKVLNTIGQAVTQKKYQHAGTDHTETITMPANIIPGNYKLVVISGSSQQVFNIIVL